MAEYSEEAIGLGRWEEVREAIVFMYEERS
ncbi:MAG: hypothetical protein RLZZ435_1169 [Cyanobacteriota bacterium]|jgi:hypothetical protein